VLYQYKLNLSLQENNASLWLDGLEGALESNDGVSNIPHHVTSHLVEDHAQMSESMAHMVEVEGVEPNSLGVAELEGHSQEVENVTMEPMDVDVQVRKQSCSQFNILHYFLPYSDYRSKLY